MPDFYPWEHQKLHRRLPCKLITTAESVIQMKHKPFVGMASLLKHKHQSHHKVQD